MRDAPRFSGSLNQTMNNSSAIIVKSSEPAKKSAASSRFLSLPRFLLVVATGTALVLPTWPGFADPAAQPSTYSNTTPGAISTTVPDGACGATITAVGGSGAAASGGTTTAISQSGFGGGGAVIGARFKVLPLQAVTGTVAGGGKSGFHANTTGGDPGSGASSGGWGGAVASGHRGGGGGGSTDVRIGGTRLIVAGGGGGGGGTHQRGGVGIGGNGGSTGIVAGGVVEGQNGTAGYQLLTGAVGGGQGGQTSAGGTGGINANVANGAPFAGFAGSASGTGGNGGNDTTFDSGGGGGGGYTGGGGGASTTNQTESGAGGGGGSSFVALNSPIVATSAATNVTGSNNPQMTGGSVNGADGSASITWVPCNYQLAVTKTVSPASMMAGSSAVWTITVTNNGPDPMTRGDLVTVTDSSLITTGGQASTYTVLSMATSGGTNDANMANGSMTCTGLTVGGTMPSSTVYSRPYSASTAPGAPSGGSRGLNVGESLTITFRQTTPTSFNPCGTSISNTASAVDRSTSGAWTTTTRNGTGSLGVQCFVPPVVRVQKKTVGGFGGPFSFTQTGLASSISAITTTAANTNTPTSPTTNTATAGTAVSLTETVSGGYAATGVSCTDANAATTGNSTAITSTTGTVTIPAANIKASADYTCLFTNIKLPTITLSKTTVGGVGAFTFTGDNGWTSQTITTATSGTGVAGATQTLAAAATATTITETAVAGFGMSAVTCSGTGGGTQPTVNLTARTIAFTAAQMAAGSTITCTVTNIRQATLTLVKTIQQNLGGTALPTAWTLTATGPTNISGATGAGTVTTAFVDPGTYTLSESGGPANYSAGNYSCVVNGGAAVSGNSLVLAGGNVAVCTIKNYYTPATSAASTTMPACNGTWSSAVNWTTDLTSVGNTNVFTRLGNQITVNVATIPDFSSGTATAYSPAYSGPYGGNPMVDAKRVDSTITFQTAINSARFYVTDLDVNESVTVYGELDGVRVTPSIIDGPSSEAMSRQVWPDGSAVAQRTASGTNNTADEATAVLFGFNSPVDKIFIRHGYRTYPIQMTTTGSMALSDIQFCGDYTDAPLSYGDTYQSAAPATALGATSTGDDGPFDNATATGDTDNAISSSPTISLVPASTYTLSAIACTGTGSIYGYIDFNRDGDFADGNERSALATCASGTSNVIWTLPASLSNLSAGTSFMRLRTASDSTQIVSATTSASTGEVEDYEVTLTEAPKLTLLKTVVNTGAGTAVDTAWTLSATGPQTISGVEGDVAITNAAIAAGTYALAETGGPASYTGADFSCVKNSGAAVSGNSIVLETGDVATCSVTNTYVPAADLVVTKSDGTTGVNPGSSTTYIVRVTNNGPDSVTGATFSDPAATGLSKTAVSCSAAASNQCSTAPTIANLEAGTVSLPALASGAFYEVEVTADVTATSGTVANAATATVPSGTNDPNSANSTQSDTDSVDIITLDKSLVSKNDVVADGRDTVGDTITYAYAIAAPAGNTRAIALTSISDDRIGAITVTTPFSGDSNSNGILDPGETWIVHADYTLTLADMNAGQVINTAHAAGTTATGTLQTANDSVTENLVQAPSLMLQKRVEDGTPTPLVAGRRLSTNSKSPTLAMSPLPVLILPKTVSAAMELSEASVLQAEA